MTEKETLEMGVVVNGNTEKDIQIEDIKNPRSALGTRHVQVFLHFLLVFLAYGIRVTLSVGIVAMTDPLASPNPDIQTHPEWTDKSILLSSFFWGYVIPQIGAGWLALKYGPKHFLTVTMAICSTFCMCLPSMASVFGSKGVMASRAIQGFCQGFIFPSLHNLLSKWAPASERSRLGTFVYAGGSLGTVVSMLVTGIISASWYGWPMVFYLYGGLGITWAVIWAILGSNSPAEHSSISEAEKYFIETSLGHSDEKKQMPTPWGKILTSLAVWAVLVSHCGQNWGFWTLMTEIPSYMSHVMHFDIKSNSYLSALPYFILWILSFIFGSIADLLIVRGVTTVGTTRKIFNSIGLVIPALALVSLGMTSPSHMNTAIALLFTAVSVNSAVYCGFNVNHIDLSPNHSGTLMGLTNCISNIFSLIAPLVVQVVVTREEDASQWKVIFFLAAGIYIAANTLYVIFGSGEIQPWNDEETKETTPPRYTKKAAMA